jgi:glycosyltransferase involved in cell wall biosynthesis
VKNALNSLSVCIVTKNEALNISDCLKSVEWADEIIIVDSCSTDETVNIAREFTNKIIINPWKGCGPQKKQATELATCDWILILDADERVSPLLKQEIQNILSNSKNNAQPGYTIPFQSYYLGKPIRFGDWFGEKHLRLFQRNKGHVIPRLVHFRVEVTGSIGKLSGKILHYSFPNLATVINKMNTYSTDGATHKYSQNKTAGLLTALRHGIFAFIRGYILKLGFLDGKEGFILAISNAEGSYYRYLKLSYISSPTENYLPHSPNNHQLPDASQK